MNSGDRGRPSRVRESRGACITRGLGLVLAFLAAGCTADRVSNAVSTLGQTAARSGSTVAFESIEGPPPAVFNRLVDNLGREAQARRIAIVSREGPAAYRIRGYMAAHVVRGRVQIGWVFDVYDAERRRSVRIMGEEPSDGRRAADAWEAADEPMVRQIARTSLDRLAAYLGGADGAPAGDPPASGAATVAAADARPMAFAAYRQ